MIMKKPVFFIFLLSYFFFTHISFSQQVRGVVLDGKTNNPIIGASVYFHNTSIGISTNHLGEFSLFRNKRIKTPLIVSFIGYNTVTQKHFSSSKKLVIYLYESNDILDGVVINTNDGWSRKLKLTQFLKHFLGDTSNGRSCNVLNEENLVLRYNSKKKQLTAKSKAPIYIKNKNLKYLISVDLNHFEVNYSYVSKNNKQISFDNVYYSGHNFFKSEEEKLSKETIQKRAEVYEGSVLRFMRALARKKLSKEGYAVYYRNLYVKEKKYIEVKPLDEEGYLVSVHLKKKIHINKKGLQSSVESFVNKFYIDSFGNHFPAEKVLFGGDFGSKRMGDTLPLDYLDTAVKPKKK